MAIAVSVVEAAEHGLALIGGDADAVIGDAEPNGAAVVLPESNRYRAALGTELDGVVEQIGDDQFDSKRVDHGGKVIRSVEAAMCQPLFMTYRTDGSRNDRVFRSVAQCHRGQRRVVEARSPAGHERREAT